MQLERFDYIDDEDKLHLNSKIDAVKPETKFGCGIYTFKKMTNN